jgi:hypothetical protein
LALRNGPAPILRRMSDQLALRHDQQKGIEINLAFAKKWLRPAGWRFTPAAARITRRLEKGRHAGSGLAQAGTGRNFYSYLLKPAPAHTFRGRPAEAPFPPR